MDIMSRIRTYTVGREVVCDVPVNDGSVSRVHAEVVRLGDGRLFVTDRASMNGTFVLEAGRWRAVRQVLLEPGGVIRFGECQMSAVELDGLCPRQDGRTPGRVEAEVAVGLAEEERGEPRRRNPETGEIVYEE